jgi:transposase
METNNNPTTMSKKELCKHYKVSYETFNTWLKRIPELNEEKGQRIFTPKQVRLIFEHLG